MRRSTPLLLTVTVSLIASLACGFLPSIPVTAPSMDANAISTAIMQTMAVAATQTAQADLLVAAPVSTPTPEPPTLTPTITASPTSIFTSTPLVPVISVSMDTNCRTGPGQVYDQVGALKVGETTEVFGREPNRNYWYVQNPDQEGEFCWLWGKYATVSGNIFALPLYTPPPTPTPLPDFEAAYSGLEKCAGWWVDIQLTNTGGLEFKSVAAVIVDASANIDLALYADQFKVIDDCVSSTINDVLHVGQTLVVSIPAFVNNPSGHKLRATITLCSATGQRGACVTKVIKFSP